jgi:hypothetical protein
MMADEPSHHLGRVFMSYMSQILRLSPEFSIAACTAGQKSLNARSISSVFPDVLYSVSSQYGNRVLFRFGVHTVYTGALWVLEF